MRAAVLEQFGGPEVIEPATLPTPAIDAREMLIRVSACGVCGHDLLARAGRLGGSLPRVLGHEIAGVVAAVGEGVSGFAVGHRVVLNQRRSCGRCAACRRGRPNHCTKGAGFYGEDLPGGYADYVVAEESNAVVLPPEVSDEDAAALPCGVVTALHALRRARVGPDDVVAIVGAGGGVGIHALALAAHLGARVIAVTHRADKAEALREAGADEVVAAEVAEAGAVRAAAGGSVDAVIDCTGIAVEAAVRMLRHGGRLAVLGNIDPGPANLPTGALILKEIDLFGSSHGTPAELADAVRLVADGHVRPRIAGVFDLMQAAEAHRAVASGSTVGRVLIRADRPNK